MSEITGGLFEEDEQVLLRLAKKGEWASFSTILVQIDKEHPALRVVDKISGWNILFYAVADNQMDILNQLVEFNCSFSHHARDSRNLCHIAAQFGNVMVAELVISQFSTEEALLPTSGGLCTPIHYACARPGSTDVARVFIRLGREHRLTPDAEGCLPIMYACEVGNVALCRELLLLYAIEQVTFSNMKTGDTVLHTACRNKHLELIKLFCDQGAQLDAQNNEGHTPLHVASWEGMEETVSYLYQKGASAHIIDKMDRSPLHISAERGHTAVVEILIDKFKASIAARTKDGSTLLHIASQCGHPDTALMFLKKGVPLLMPNKTGAVCLHVAAAQGHVAVVKALCQKGANVDFKNKDGQTALHLAVRKCKPIVVQTLLGFGANVQLFASGDKQTPLHVASKVVTNGERVAEMLIKSGADVNAQDAEGETPAHVAVRHGNMKVLKFLLGENADPTITSATGETILHMSVRFCHFQITKKLLEYTVEELTHADAVKLVNLPNAEGETIVHLVGELVPESAHYEREELMIAKLLLEYEADLFKGSTLTSETPLHYCARGGNSSVLSAFLAYMHESASSSEDKGGPGKSKVTENNQICTINIRNAAGWSPLMVAAEHGHPEVVEILLNNNARIDLFDEQGSTALHFACENGNVEVADELLWHHAFVGARTRKGITPLHLAAKNGHSRLCQLLIESHGAQLDILSLGKRTPLHMAAFEGRLDVCDVLLDLQADAAAKDMDQQTPLHLAAENNYPEIVKLFLNYKPELASITNGNGRTCAHIAASNGSLAVLKSMAKFNREGLIEDRDSVSGSLCLHLAAAGGYGKIVKILIESGANPLEENDEGLTPLHLAAQHGHLPVLEALKVARVPLNYCSKISGLTGIHVAAFFGQAEFVQELLQNVNGQEVSAPPAGIEAATTVRFGSTSNATSENIDYEYGFSPLHLAAQRGHENVVRILLNSTGVQPECQTAIHGTTPLHLAAQEGHSSVIGLMLSKHESLLSVVDNRSRTALHMAAANGHTSLVTLLIGQGADVNHKDDSDWTPLHFAAKAGHHPVIQILIQSGASALMETSDLKQPICYAAANGHQESLNYLMRKEHNSHKLIADNRFIFDLILCGDSADDPYNMVRDFILWSPAPLEIAVKLAANYRDQSAVRVDRAKDLFIASKFCQKMAVDLTSVSSVSPDAAKKIVNSEDLHGVSMLDVMIECEQKEVVAHASTQQYLSDVWMGQYAMETWHMLLLLLAVILPPVFVVLCLPIKWIKINRIPFVKMLLYITSHIYFITLLTLAVAFRIQAFEGNAVLLPKWSEWLIVAFFCGLVLTELLNPSDKSGLGILRIIVLLLGCIAVIIHLSAFSMGDKENQYNMVYIRNQILGCVLLCCFVQLLEFLTFHHMFGPWAIIISDLMKDLFRFAVLIGIFVIGFTLEFATINQPAYPEDFCTAIGRYPLKSPETGTNNTYIDGGRVVSEQFTKMAFSIFGLVDYQAMTDEAVCIPIWAEIFTYFIYGLYLVIALIVLINLLIAMMSDTYQRIQQQSDIEWKFGRALLIRSMNLKTPAAPPVNLIVVVIAFFYGLYKRKGITYVTRVLTQDDSTSVDDEDHSSKVDEDGERSTQSSVTAASVRRKLSKKDPPRKVRVENVIDWDEVVKLYREMHHVEEEGGEDTRKKTDFTNYDLGGSFNTKKVIEEYFDFSN